MSAPLYEVVFRENAKQQWTPGVVFFDDIRDAQDALFRWSQGSTFQWDIRKSVSVLDSAHENDKTDAPKVVREGREPTRG